MNPHADDDADLQKARVGLWRVLCFCALYVRALGRGLWWTEKKAYAAVSEHHRSCRLGVTEPKDCWSLFVLGEKTWRISLKKPAHTIFVTAISAEERAYEEAAVQGYEAMEAALRCPRCKGHNTYQMVGARRGCYDCDDEAMLASLKPGCPVCGSADVAVQTPGSCTLQCHGCGHAWDLGDDGRDDDGRE